MKALELTGQTFNNLTVIRRVRSVRKGESHWECKCICGNIKVYSSDHLTRKIQPVKSCGCLRKSRGNQHKDWTGVGEISGAWWATHVTREIKPSNKRHRVECTLTIDFAWNLFLKQNRKCTLSGVDLCFALGRNGTASLDRIDSSKGYVENNVQWVHKHINFMKRDYDETYFIEMCKKVANNKVTQNDTE